MPTGTLDRSPPPFFRQGPSALTRLAFFASLAVFLMAADTRLGLSGPLRTAVATVVHPVELALLRPVQAVGALGDYFSTVTDARRAEEAARTSIALQAQRALQVETLTRENAALRGLLELNHRLEVRGHAAEVLYQAADPFSRKIVIDRGLLVGIKLASPVINEAGVLGQVTRVYPMNAEVTLLTDRDAAMPVLNARSQQRSIVVGHASGGLLEMRYMAANADVKVGDPIVTTGLDGVYPPGYPVAKVVEVDRQSDSSFARIRLAPEVRVDGVRHVLVLDPLGAQLPPRPQSSEPAASRPARKGGPRK
jgi:rod shape-determining protein MreC